MGLSQFHSINKKYGKTMLFSNDNVVWVIGVLKRAHLKKEMLFEDLGGIIWKYMKEVG